MQQNFCKFSLLQLLCIGGYTKLRENCNNSTRSSLLKFVAGHGTVVQPASISYLNVNKHSNIVEHIIWVLSELSVAVHKMLNRR